MTQRPHNTSAPVDMFLPHMRDVARCEASLHELNLIWRMIESTAKMTCPDEAQSILPTMAATRAGFTRLEQELVSSLVNEKATTVLDAIDTQAHYVIDIVVRNLYERTADVGFLATDQVLCDFVAGHTRDTDAIRARLVSYQRKYTVYSDIMLMDLEGNVLVQTDPTAPVEGSTDPLIAEALSSNAWVETFRTTDLRPGMGPALVYAQRMLHPTHQTPVGVLCLFFGFEVEMQGIFRSHNDPQGHSLMLLLDGDNRVIASADPHWIPCGATVPVNPQGSPTPLLFAGRPYLVRTQRAQGYQGYPGPSGWQGQVMVPVDLAFQRTGLDSPLATLPPAIASGLLSHARAFSPPLHEVVLATETIKRVVWNGQVITAGQGGQLRGLKNILDQISETGARSNEVFSASIKDLYDTVLTAKLQQNAFVSRLLVDLLDRNLYERADDCRWWAMTPGWRAALSGHTPDGDQLAQVLRHIHSLYTVYTHLYLYDRQGRVLAVSDNAKHGGVAVGDVVDVHTLQQVMALADEQRYHVSAFEATAFTGGAPTYTYHAAVRAPNSGQPVGGVGIVFNAATEFQAMLEGALAGRPGAQAYFLRRDGHIIASTHPDRPAGTHLPLPSGLTLPGPGGVYTQVVVMDGQYMALACAANQGYREFKTTDGYREDVLGLVLTPLGETRATQGLGRDSGGDWHHQHTAHGGIEYATFYVHDSLYALPAEGVLEARPAIDMTPAPKGGHPARVGMLPQNGGGGSQPFVWVYDLGALMGQPLGSDGEGGQVVVLSHGAQTIGLLVTALHAVPTLASEHMMPSPFGSGLGPCLIPQLAKAQQGRVLIAVLDPAVLCQSVGTAVCA